MDEKKVREAIKYFEHLKDVLENYLKMPNAEQNLGVEIVFIKRDIDIYNTAIEALQKQLRLKPEKVYDKECVEYKCPICGNNLKTVYPDYKHGVNGDCFKCKQPIDWLKE